MEQQNKLDFLDNTPNQLYDEDNQIRFKTSMLKSHLSAYSDACIFVKGTITVVTLQSCSNNKYR